MNQASFPTMQTQAENPCELKGISFVELASPEPEKLHQLLQAFGFSRVMRHLERPIDLYRQHDIIFLINRTPAGFAAGFSAAHGPSICSMGWRVAKSTRSFETATSRGARAGEGDLSSTPAIYGIGDSLIYFIDDATTWAKLGFVSLEKPNLVPDKGFCAIDHLTNNVPKGSMQTWAHFYKTVFGFTEVRYFDIRGVKTGLTSYALRSPCGTFCIPINEGTEAKSQINEYLDEYRGPGIQHLAFLTNDILASLRNMTGPEIQFLDIERGYYDEVFKRVPNVKENHEEIAARNVLVDGDNDGYLLQIFTQNLIGPIFIELIQRNNHWSFGEGNFGALFRSIERDQEKRGYL